MTDFYEALGVPRTAKAAAITAAYRKIVMTIHPDQGGGRAEFELATRARDCLIDPERRAFYDLTGRDFDSLERKHEDTKLMRQMIEGLVNEAIAESDVDLCLEDMGALMKKMVDGKRRLFRNDLDKVIRKKTRLETALKRFKRRRKKNASDALKPAMENLIAQYGAEISEGNRQIALLGRLLSIVDGYRYTVDPPPPTFSSPAFSRDRFQNFAVMEVRNNVVDPTAGT